MIVNGYGYLTLFELCSIRLIRAFLCPYLYEHNQTMLKNINQPIKETMKTYRVEIQALAYFDVEAENSVEAINQVPTSLSMPIEGGIGGSIFYEEFDHKKAIVEKQ